VTVSDTDEVQDVATRLRALAHPMRWKLIDLLDGGSSATATQCAVVLKESVASCSYHLGILAKYGYVELVPDVTGREKPWRLSSSRHDLRSSTPDSDETRAAHAAGEAFLDHELTVMKSRLRHAHDESPDWRTAITAVGATVSVTSAELRELKDDVTDTILRFERQKLERTLRPTDARRSRIFFSTSVEPEHERD
jgi:hypothetical protein